MRGSGVWRKRSNSLPIPLMPEYSTVDTHHPSAGRTDGVCQ
uniref:Uncharacterized protein n=1 Tax=Anguilla anguilla TaxID=7936 RepID=A0A0E9UCR4_ANGAN